MSAVQSESAGSEVKHANRSPEIHTMKLKLIIPLIGGHGRSFLRVSPRDDASKSYGPRETLEPGVQTRRHESVATLLDDDAIV